VSIPDLEPTVDPDESEPCAGSLNRLIHLCYEPVGQNLLRPDRAGRVV